MNVHTSSKCYPLTIPRNPSHFNQLFSPVQKGSLLSQVPAPPIVKAQNGHTCVPMTDSIQHILAHDIPVEPLLSPHLRSFKQSHSITPRGRQLLGFAAELQDGSNGPAHIAELLLWSLRWHVVVDEHHCIVFLITAKRDLVEESNR